MILVNCQNLQCQGFSLTYELRNKSEVPKNIPSELTTKMHEILEEKSKTIRIEKVTYDRYRIFARIDTVYYEKGFTNPHKIRTSRSEILYYFDGTNGYCTNSSMPTTAYKIEQNDMVYQNYCDHKKIINGFECTKITCTFLDEDFTLWVTDIPNFHGGPYVFLDFPTLVIQAYSNKREYILKGMQCVNDPKIPDDIISGKIIKPIVEYIDDLISGLK